MEFPEEAGFPTPILKGFQKTELVQPGMRTKVTFRLTERDFSYFDGLDGDYPRWMMVDKVTVMIGASSADIRATKTAYPRNGKDSAYCMDRPGCTGLTPLDGLCCPVKDGTMLACCNE